MTTPALTPAAHLRAPFADPARPALVIYLTAGDPDAAVSLDYLLAAAAAGADVLEVGVPFSDPMADGPVIQRATERALAAGTTLRGTLALVAELRRRAAAAGHAPRIVLFGYLNPFLAFGPPDALAAAARDAGADALLAVDLPGEAGGPLRASLRAAGLGLIPLVAPTTTPERLALVKETGAPFVYYVSLAGVTGAAVGDLGPVGARVAEVRRSTNLPVALGFGISTPAEAAAAGAFADGVVVGSAAVRIVATHGASPSGPEALGRFVSSLAEAVHGSRPGRRG